MFVYSDCIFTICIIASKASVIELITIYKSEFGLEVASGHYNCINFQILILIFES